MTGARPAFDVVATDLDRTFSREDLTLDPAALAALADLRRAGVLAVLATGRTEAEVAERPGLAGAFDGYVLESGARIGRWGALRDTPAPSAGLDRVCTELAAAGVDVWRGPRSASIPRHGLALAAQLGARHGVDALPNRDRVDLVPAGIGKGPGLRDLLDLLAPGRRLRVAAIGDGENDLGLLGAADLAIAVPNASTRLLRVAHEVAPRPAAQGFAWLVRERVLRQAASPSPVA